MLQVQCFTFSPIQENTYIVFNESLAAAIIDPGCYWDDEKEKLSQFIADNNLKVTYLLNTHCHLDHVFGNKYVAEKYELELHLHHLETNILKDAPQRGEMFMMPFDGYTGKLNFIDENNTIKLGDDELSILHLPGHSPGSIGFYCAKQHFIISGDVLFYESIGRTDLPQGNYDTLIHSIATKMYQLPENTIVFNGHGNTTTIQHEKKNNPFIIA